MLRIAFIAKQACAFLYVTHAISAVQLFGHFASVAAVTVVALACAVENVRHPMTHDTVQLVDGTVFAALSLPMTNARRASCAISVRYAALRVKPP